MYTLDILVCESSGMLNLIYIAKICMNLIRIGVPILLIILCMLDLVKIITGKDGTDKKVFKKIIERFLSAVIVFFVFDIVVFVINFIADVDITSTNCYKKANKEQIRIIKAKEEAARQKLIEERERAKKAKEEKEAALRKKLLEQSKNNSSSGTIQGDGKANGRFIWPAPGTTVITSGVGPRWGRHHNGLDISSGNAYGSPIVAADGGKVTVAVHSGWGGGYGLHVFIDHGNGYVTVYGHASRVLVNVGDKVSKGQKIALIGSTGDSTGPHLHFEIRKNGQIVDPENYVKPS